MYGWIKLVHVTCVGLSFGLFLARGLWLFMGPPRPLWRWLRVAPHLVDTLLLGSGLTLAFLIGRYPFFNSAWLTAKVLGLCAYIALGMMALHSSRRRSLQLAAWISAMVVFAYIVSIAVSKEPAGFLILWY